MRRERTPSQTTLTAFGALDTYTATAFRDAIDRCDVGSTDVVVDLSAVSLLDTAGLAALRVLDRRVRAAGRRARFVTNDSGAFPLRVAGLTAEARGDHSESPAPRAIRS